MPRSRKRHHSRSRSKTRSRSPSGDKSYDKQKKPSSHEKDGKRRRLDELIESPAHKRSLSSQDDQANNERVQDVELLTTNPAEAVELSKSDEDEKSEDIHDDKDCEILDDVKNSDGHQLDEKATIPDANSTNQNLESIVQNDEPVSIHMEVIYEKKDQLTTPKKPLTPKQLQKKIESEKKKQQKQKEREERENQRIAEKQRIKEQKEAERQKLLEEKQKQLELKQKEKEMKDEQKKKEREEKEQKRKEKEEQESQKRKEKEQERLKKLQEIEEKNKEKQKEVEKKQKTAALFKNFFKKTEAEEREAKSDKIVNSNFMPFEVKSDMRLPPSRREPLSHDEMNQLDLVLESQDDNMSYLKDLKSGKFQPGKSTKTWPYEDPEDEEVTIIGEDKMFGETIDEDTSLVHKMKAKFLLFHENRRPAYFGTWRKKSKVIKPRRPFEEDTVYFNYEEDSDDDWEEEEQGESLDVSGDEDEKEPENDQDDYEVDNDFFVPHGHLSDDEMDDEENARLSPESLKQKLKLLKDEFEEDIKSKTHKLKPRFIGCVWFDQKGDNVEDAIYRFLQPYAMIVNGPVHIKKRSEIFASPSEKKKMKTLVELPSEHIPFFLKIIHGNVNKKKTVIEEFLTLMANNDHSVEVSKANLTRFLKKSATYRRCQDDGPMKNKFGWFVNDDVKDKYNVSLGVTKTDS